jgi:hypothetical protein
MLTVSRFGFRRCPPFCCPLDNHPPFPEFCAKAENGFVAAENCFVAATRRNRNQKSPIFSNECARIVNSYWRLEISLEPNGLVAQWASQRGSLADCAMISGAGTRIGDPQ